MKKQLMLGLCLLFLLSVSLPANACTLWAATGSRVEGGGSIIAKNRDWTPNHTQELRLVKPSDGFKYYGIFAVGGDVPGLKAGINERGLVVITASASSIPRQQRLTGEHTKGILTTLLKTCDSVDKALAKTDLFVGAKYLMLADSTKSAIIEIAPNGQYAIHENTDGVLWHTNHYVDKDLLSYNLLAGESSTERYNRIAELLHSTANSYSIDDFIAFSNDRIAGPDNSIWRTGSSAKRPHTLSSWIVYLPPQGMPVLYVKLANPGQKEQILALNTKEVFN